MTWRYFRRDTEVATLYGLYRCPANGKRIFEQKLEDVHIYRQDGSWLGSQRNGLVDAELKGWFDPAQDEISEAHALLLMSKISSGQVSCGFEERIRRRRELGLEG
jgi:hypothetical protein